MTKTAIGKKAESSVQSWLLGSGINVRRAAYYAPFDLYTDLGTSIEVKFSSPAIFGKGKYAYHGWRISLHRHGERRVGSEVDIYIFCLSMDTGLLKQLGCGSSCHLIIPAKDLEGTLTVAISVRSLLTRYAKYYNNFQAIKDSESTKTPHDLRETQIRALIASSTAASLAYAEAENK